MTNPPAGIEQEWVEATVRALWEAWQQSDNVTPNAKGISWDTIAESRESNIAARSFYDAGIAESIAAIRVLAPLITARERERCAQTAARETASVDACGDEWSAGWGACGEQIESAIRAPTQGETG